MAMQTVKAIEVTLKNGNDYQEFLEWVKNKLPDSMSSSLKDVKIIIYKSIEEK